LRQSLGGLRRFFRKRNDLESQEENKAIDELARTLGLQNEMERMPAELSGGQEQRVALGRVLMQRPKVLLLDEPLGHLDGPLRVDLRRQLHLLHRQFPATMVYVTHDPEEALALGDRVAVLDQGTVRQVGKPEELYCRPANVQVARLLCQNHAPLNILPGTLSGETDLVLSVSGVDFSVPEMLARTWLAYRGTPVMVGIRPEDIEISDRNSGPGVISMQVDLIESLGERYLATCTGRGLSLSGLCPTRLARGRQVMLKITWQRAMLFDQNSGRTLGSEAG
jgi:ABC-type sugar transport system ATPase subunit